ncbi:MAG: hypothetical protein K2J73_12350 [Oscillospiraceae bacterium]|nr:hypothetical protein [Oscillospiraceae bacterium]
MNVKVISAAVILAVCITLSGCAEDMHENVPETSSSVFHGTSSADSETKTESETVS